MLTFDNDIVYKYLFMQLNTFFKDLKVIELASVLAGPSVGMFFAELGAKVIKVENKITGGDVTRKWKLPQEDKKQPLSAYYHSINWNKESHLLDLQNETDNKQVVDWIKEADIVISNFKSGSAEKIGMDYQRLAQINPRMIYAEINAYGKNNPKPGFDVVIQAETGWIFMNGEADGLPVKLPVALMDVLAAHQLKEGILLALLHRYQTGKGCEVSVSLFDSGLASLVNQASNYLNAGIIPQRMGSRHPNIAPYGDIFYTKDNKAIIVAPGTEKQFHGLCDCLNIPELKTDERFLTNALRLSNRPALYDLLKDKFYQVKAKGFLLSCQERGVPVAPIQNLEEVFALPEAQDLILEETLSDGTVSKRVKSAVFKISESK